MCDRKEDKKKFNLWVNKYVMVMFFLFLKDIGKREDM